MVEEHLDVVDGRDRVVGRRSVADCIRNGLLHRGVVIFLRNKRGDVYLQKRSAIMVWYPGRWSASCTGHVSSGESYLEGALRELKEELGTACELREIGKVQTPKWPCEGGTEWEFDAVFEGQPEEVRFTLNQEVESGKWVSYAQAKRMIEGSPDVFTPDSVLAFREYARYRRVYRR